VATVAGEYEKSDNFFQRLHFRVKKSGKGLSPDYSVPGICPSAKTITPG
jgi:hypothetical protein